MALRFLEVFALGMLCGLIPGPVVTALFTETIRAGVSKARRIVGWAALGELIISVVCVVAFSLLNPKSTTFAAISIFGSLILLNIAWDLWRVEEISEREPLFSRQRIFFLAILNGMAWIFWITVCTPQAMQLEGMVAGGKWLFVVLFELGWILSTLCLVQLFSLFRPFFQNNRILRHAYRAIALLFIFFAVRLAYGSIVTLLI